MTATAYFVPCSPLCGTVYHAPSCPRFSASHDPASGEPFALIPAFDSVAPDSPFAEGATDDPDATFTDPAEACPRCGETDCMCAPDVPDDHGSPADEYDMRPPRDGADFGEDD